MERNENIYETGGEGIEQEKQAEEYRAWMDPHTLELIQTALAKYPKKVFVDYGAGKATLSTSMLTELEAKYIPVDLPKTTSPYVSEKDYVFSDIRTDPEEKFPQANVALARFFLMHVPRNEHVKIIKKMVEKSDILFIQDYAWDEARVSGADKEQTKLGEEFIAINTELARVAGVDFKMKGAYRSIVDTFEKDEQEKYIVGNVSVTSRQEGNYIHEILPLLRNFSEYILPSIMKKITEDDGQHKSLENLKQRYKALIADLEQEGKIILTPPPVVTLMIRKVRKTEDTD